MSSTNHKFSEIYVSNISWYEIVDQPDCHMIHTKTIVKKINTFFT
jgi:hypothetical protein